MVFKETPVFTKLIKELMSDEHYAGLQSHLVEHPDAGDVIEGTGGLRKIRWSLPGTGKSGGVRVIYFWRVSESQILMMLVYPKSAKSSLSAEEKKQLRNIKEKW